jgi:chemotaxis response regulator CheB
MDTRTRIKVVVVDDSALVRGLLSEIINRQADMQCVGVAADPLQAREVIRAVNPDVITSRNEPNACMKPPFSQDRCRAHAWIPVRNLCRFATQCLL